MDEQFFFYNGRRFAKGTPVITAGHPALAFGDGIFETMRLHKGIIINKELHLNRMIQSCEVMKLELNESRQQQILQCVQMMTEGYPDHHHLRVRISIFRRNNSFSNQKSPVDYIVEGRPAEAPAFNEKGWEAIVYTEAVKGSGKIANLKSNNFLLHTTAGRFAAAEGRQESIILNCQGRVCETSIANIFFIENGRLFTPPLSEGCVAGTIRQWLINHSGAAGHPIIEEACTVERLLQAEEVFLTNAIRWVIPLRRINETAYKVHLAKPYFDLLHRNLMTESHHSS